MLKQYGGKMHTGFWKLAKSFGVDHVRPPSVDLDTYRTVPLPPCTPLSNVRYALPCGSVTMRWSWLFLTFPAVTCVTVKLLPPSCDTATITGECELPSNCAH